MEQPWNDRSAGKSKRPGSKNFQQSLRLRPTYVVALLLNLGTCKGAWAATADAEKTMSKALELEPEKSEVNYALGMLYARQNQLDRATQFLEKAITLRPSYSDALNNLECFTSVKTISLAEEKFKTCNSGGAELRSGLPQSRTRLRPAERQRKSQSNLAGASESATRKIKPPGKH